MSLRTRIIHALAPGDFVSGESLARDLGVSRAAVNHHIRAITESGFEIHSVRGRGYRLASPISPLDKSRIESGLRKTGAHVPVIDIFDQVESTNSSLRRLLLDGARAPRVCLAEHQTRGRGRRGRVWLNRPYQSILFSYAYDLDAGVTAASGLSLAVGIAVQRALVSYGLTTAQLKWPNDLQVTGKKLGGILVEIAGEVGSSCTCVIGIGLNVRLDEEARANVAQPVTDIEQELGRPVNRSLLVVKLITQLAAVLTRFSQHGFSPFVEEWQALHAHRGQAVSVRLGDETVHGIAAGVDGAGALRLVDGSGNVHRVTTGEVQA